MKTAFKAAEVEEQSLGGGWGRGRELGRWMEGPEDLAVDDVHIDAVSTRRAG
jgi:hypothetical protein